MKLQGTNIFVGERDLKLDNMPQKETEKGKWVIARPIGLINFWHTLGCAWKVLRNQADIVIWKHQ